MFIKKLFHLDSLKKVCLAMVVALMCAGVWATDYTWTGTTDNKWNLNTNWSNPTNPTRYANSATANAIFNSAATPELGVNIQVNNLNCNADVTITLANHTLTAATINVADGCTLTIDQSTANAAALSATTINLGSGSKLIIKGQTTVSAATVTSTDSTASIEFAAGYNGNVDNFKPAGFLGDINGAGLNFYDVSIKSTAADKVTITISRTDSTSDETFTYSGDTVYSATTKSLSIPTLKLSSGTKTDDFDITPSAAFATGEGFSLDVKDPAGNVLKTIEYYNGPVWLGTTTSANTLSNWKGISAISDLTDQNLNIYANPIDFDSAITIGTVTSTQNVTISQPINTGAIDITGTLTIAQNADLTASGDITVSSDVTSSATIKTTSGNITFSRNYTGNSGTGWSSPIVCAGALTVKGGIFQGNISATSLVVNGDTSFLSAVSSITTTGSQTYKGDILIKGNDSDSYKATLSGSTITFEKTLTDWNNQNGFGTTLLDLTINGDAVFESTVNRLISLTVNGTIDATGTITTGTVYLKGNIVSKDLTVSGNLNISGSVGTSQAISATNLTIENTGSLTPTSSTITVTGNWTNNGTFTHGNSTVKFTPTTSSTISGDTTFYNLEVTGQGRKTIVFSDTQTISNNMILTGTAVGNELTVSGTGNIVLPNDLSTGDYLSIDAVSTPTITSNFYIADNSVSSDGSTDVSPKGWIITGSDVYIWRGKNSTDWSTTGNWIPSGYPNDSAKIVKIPSSSRYPVLSENISIKSLEMADGTSLSTGTKTLTIADDLTLGTVTIAGNITDTATAGITIASGKTTTLSGATTFTGKVTNSGTITAGSPQTLTLKNNFTDSTGTITNVNLAFTGDTAQSVSLKTNSLNFIFANTHADGVTIISQHFWPSGTVSLSGALKLSSGSFWFQKDVTITGNATLTGIAGINFAKKVTSNPTEKSLTVSCTTVGTTVAFTDTVTNLSTLIVNGQTSITKNISTSGAQSYTGAVTLAGDVTLTAKNSTNVLQDVSFTSTIDGAKTLIIDGNASFGGTVGGTGNLTSLSVNGTTSTSASISTTGTQTYTGAVTLGADSTLSASNVTFNADVSGSHALTIAGPAEITNDINLSTSSTVLNGNVTGTHKLTIDSGNTATLGAGITIAPEVINKGTITVPTGDVTFNGAYSGTGTLNAASGTTNFGANVDLSSTTFAANGGKVEFTENLTLTVKSDKSTSFNAITIDSGKTLTCDGDFNVAGNWTNNGTFAGSNSTVTFNGTTEIGGSSDTTFNNVIINGTSVTAPAGNLNVSGDWTLTSGTFDANSGTVTFTGSPTFTGETTFNNFTATGLGGKTLTLNADQTVSGTLSLSGTAVGNELKITDDGSGKGFKLSSSQTTGDYLKIGSTVRIKDSSGKCDGIDGIFYSATNSTSTIASPTDAQWATILKNGWRIKDLGDLSYTWQGGATGSETAWATRANWDIGIVPGIASLSTGATVTIPTSLSYYPIIDSNSYSVKSLTIANGASVTLGDANNLSIDDNGSSGTLSNAGTIIYKAAGRILDESGNPTNDATQGTVEYAGTCTVSSIYYFDLVISAGTVSFPSSGNIFVVNDFSVTGGSAQFDGTLTADSIYIASDSTSTADSTFISDSIDVSAKIDAGTNALVFYPKTATNVIYLGAVKASSYSLSDTEIANLKGANLTIGDSTRTGGIEIIGSIPANCSISLVTGSGSSITQTATGTLSTTGALSLSAYTGIGSISPDKPITIGSVGGTLNAANNGTGDINLSFAGAISIGDSSHLISTTSGDIKIASADAITIGGDISCSNLTLIAETSITNDATGGKLTTGNSKALSLTAKTGIGTSASPIKTVSENITASSNADDIYITNTGSTTISGVTTTAGNIGLKASAFTFSGNIQTSGDGTITISPDTTSGTLSVAVSDFVKFVTTKALYLGDDASNTINLTTGSGSLPAETTVTGTCINAGTIDTNSQKLTFANATTNNGTITGRSADLIFNGAYSGTGSLTAASGTTNFGADVDLSSTTFSANSGTIEFTEDSNLTVKSDKSTSFNAITIDSGKTLTCTGQFNVAGDWTNNGIFSGAGSTVTFNGTTEIGGTATTTFNNVVIDATHSLKAPSGDLTISGNWTNNGSFDANSGTVVFDNTVAHTLSGTTIFNNISFNHSATFDNGNTFANFTATGLGDKTITLNADQTVSGTLSLSGTAVGNELTITDDSSGKGFKLSSSQTTGDYLKIGSTVRIKDSSGNCDGIEGTYYSATNSTPDAATPSNDDWATVLKNGWRIKDLGDLSYIWQGGATGSEKDWATRANWDIGIVPGVTTVGQTKSIGATVTIPTGKTYYPELAATSYSVKSLSIESLSSVTLSGAGNISIDNNGSAGTLSNDGTIIYQDSGRIKNHADADTNDTDSGTVEYNTGTGTISNVEYFGLLITSGNWSTSNSVKANNLTVTGSPTISFNGGLETTASAISIPAGVTLTLGGTITSSGAQTYGCGITLSAATILNANSNNITLNDDISGAFSLTTKSPLVLNKNNLTIGASAGVYEEDVSAGTNDIIFSGTVTLEDGKKLTANNSNFAGNITGGSTGSGDITLDTKVTLTADISLTSNTVTIKNDIDGAYTLTLNTTANFSGASTINSDILNKGTINVPVAGISFKGNYTANDTTTGTLIGAYTSASDLTPNPNIDFYKDVSFGNFTANKDVVRFVGTTNQSIIANNQSFYDVIFNNSAAATLTDQITITHNFTNTTGFTAGSSSEVIFAGTDPSKIYGSSTFNKFTCETAGKELYFEKGKKQTITTFKIDGTDASTRIKLYSTANDNAWEIDPTTADVQYAEIRDSKNTNTNRIYAYYSKDVQNNIHWNFVGQTYTWTGAKSTTSTDWFEAENWSPKSIPGIGANIQIQDISPKTNYPVLENNITEAGQYASVGAVGEHGTITVTSPATLDFNGNNVFVGKITNNGYVRLKGSEVILKKSGSPAETTKIINAAGSTVEYYDECSANPMKGTEGKNYGNLIFSDRAFTDTGKSIDSISVAGTTLIANGTGKVLSFTGDNTFDGIVTIGNNTKDAGIISINTTADLTIANNAKADSLTITATDKTITFNGDVTTTAGAISLTGALSTVGGTAPATPSTITAGTGLSLTGDWTNNGFITASTPVTITGNFTNDTSKYFDSTSSTATTITGNFLDNGTWTSSSTTGHITFNGSGNQLVSLNPSTTYNTITVNKNSGNTTFDKASNVENLTVTSSVNNTFEAQTNVTNLSVTSAANTTFNGPVQIGSLSDAAGAGNFNFAADGFILSNTIFNTTGKVTFGSTSASSFGISKADNSDQYNLTHTAGETDLFGSLIAKNIELAVSTCKTNNHVICNSITINGNINADAGVSYLKISGDLISKGNRTISPNLMLDGNFTADSGVTTIGSSDSPTNFYLFTNSASPSPIAVTSVTVTGDLITNASRTINSSGRISAANIVLYKGNIVAANNSVLYAAKDVVLLGSNYNISNSETNNPIEYMYQNPIRLSAFNYARPDFADGTTMADGTALPTGTNDANDFTGSYTAGSESVIYAGKNFYANGLTLSGSSNWYVDVPDLTDANKGFGEAYNTIISHSIVRCHEDNSADGSKAKIPCYYCTDNGDNQNWIFDDYEFAAIYTVRDNAIRIEFNRPIRNLNGELIASLSRFSNSDSTYVGFFTDPDCTQPLENQNIPSGIIYLKAENTWNTDATGSSIGTEAATDRTGLHKEIIPYVEVARIADGELSTISDIWGKKLKNYSSDNRYTATIDETGPVLYSVKTGQETHIVSNGTAESQHSYDAHNFIEFRYSEPVNFGSDSLIDVWIPAFDSEGNVNLQENTRVTDSFGALTGDITSEGALNFIGLGTIENGKLYTGSNGQADKYVNALYRKDAYSLCVSIAGYTEDTVADPNNYTYKKWVGYIENAKMPSGTVTMNFKTAASNKNALVTDVLGNCQEEYPDSIQNTIPTVDSTETELYGEWDLSEPVFAPLRMSTIKTENGISSNNWTAQLYDGHFQSEAIGNTSGYGSTLDRIEFHLFDNTPTFQGAEPEWVSEIGWVNPGSEGKKADLYKDFSYSADIFGGARKFDDDETRRTTGGIRYSTICNESHAFKYIASMYDEPTEAFADAPAFAGANGIIFTGTATPRRSALDLDGLYFGMPLGITEFDIKETFTVSYDSSNSFITDLAGNRLRSATFTTIDRTPPSFDVTLSPLHKDELYVTFVKKLITESENIVYIDNSGEVKDVSLSGTFEQIIPSCFKLISIDENGNPSESTSLKIDTSRPAVVMPKTSDRFTCLKLYLTQEVTLEDVKNLYVSITNHPDYNKKSQDPFTSHKDSLVTFIQDSNKNYMEMYSAHALSDFAISAINPLYGYDENMTVDDPDLFDGLYSTGTWGVHDWNADQQNYGTLPANHALAIVAQTDDGTENRSNSPLSARIYLSNNPDADSVSKQYNTDFAESLRIWLPNQTDKVFAAMAEVNNKNFAAIDSNLLQEEDPLAGLIFHLPQALTETWSTGDQISFLFAFTDAANNTIDVIHSPELDLDTEEQKYLTTSVRMPLYALRLTNPDDITSIDLWSFKLRTQTKQRGGVSILNNVINPVEGEKTIIEVDNPSEGSVNVIVMTLDGNIITYLNRGDLTQGEHFFTWDGKTKNGKYVARGLYFVRILGNGFDETRKVMVVK